MDAQGSLTASLGYQHPDQLEETLATVLNKVIEDKPLEPGEGIIRQQEGVDLLPANIYLAAMEVTLVNIMSRETILREYLNTVRDQYDVILLDCCPSLGMLTINALSAADEVLIPMQAHFNHHGRYENHLFARNRGAASGYIRRPAKNFRHYHPPLHPCG